MKFDIVELIKSIITLRLANPTHRVVVGMILLIISIWGVGSFNLGRCNDNLLFLTGILGASLSFSITLSADKSKKSILKNIFEFIFIISYLISIFLILSKYYNCSGFKHFIFTPNSNSSIELKDCMPKSATKLVSKIIIKEVEKEPKNIYNTYLNYEITIYESTDSLSKSIFYLADIDYSLTNTTNNFFTNFTIGAKKVYLNFNNNIEFKTFNEIEDGVKTFVNNLSIQKESLLYSSKEVNFEGNLNEWNKKISEFKIMQQDFNDLGNINSLKRKVKILENRIYQLQNTSLKNRIVDKNEQVTKIENNKNIPSQTQILDSLNSCRIMNQRIEFYTSDIIKYKIQIDELEKLIEYLKYQMLQKKCREIN